MSLAACDRARDDDVDVRGRRPRFEPKARCRLWPLVRNHAPRLIDGDRPDRGILSPMSRDAKLVSVHTLTSVDALAALVRVPPPAESSEARQAADLEAAIEEVTPEMKYLLWFATFILGLRVLIRSQLADGRLPTNGMPRVWTGPGNGNGETAYRCTTCGGSFYAERTFQARDGLYYCVQHILERDRESGMSNP